MSARGLEKFVLVIAALHSLVLGSAMLFRPAWTLELVGWELVGPTFFPAQSGVFLIILGGAYVVGVRYRPFAWLLVASKATAVAFLVGAYVVGAGPRSVLLAAMVDASIGAAAAVAVTGAMRSRRHGSEVSSQS